MPARLKLFLPLILFVVLVLRRGILDFYMDKRAEARDRRAEREAAQ